MVQVDPQILARHPEWNNILNGAGNIAATPQVAGGATMPASTSQGTIPLTQNNLPYPAANSLQGGNPLQAQWEAEQNVINAKTREIGLERAAIPYRLQASQAEAGVETARAKDVEASRALLAEQNRANEAKFNEDKAIAAAANDEEDIIAVARGLRQRQAYTYRARIAGLDNPIEVDLPEGFTGQLPPGIVRKIETVEAQLKEQQTDAEFKRRYNIEAARIHAANTGLAVNEAQIASGKVKLKLDEVEAAIRAASLDTQQADLALRASDLPPQPGLVFDATSGTWTSPSQKSLNESLQRETLQREHLGELGQIPVDTLMSMATQKNPVLTDEQLKAGLIAHGMSPTTADYYVKLAAERRANSGDSIWDSFPELKKLFDDALKNRGTTSPPPKPQSSTATLNIPLIGGLQFQVPNP